MAQYAGQQACVTVRFQVVVSSSEVGITPVPSTGCGHCDECWGAVYMHYMTCHKERRGSPHAHRTVKQWKESKGSERGLHSPLSCQDLLDTQVHRVGCGTPCLTSAHPTPARVCAGAAFSGLESVSERSAAELPLHFDEVGLLPTEPSPLATGSQPACNRLAAP